MDVRLRIGIDLSVLLAYGCKCCGVDDRDMDRGVEAREPCREEGVLGLDEGRCPKGRDSDSSCSRIFLAVLLVTPGRMVVREIGFTLIGFCSSVMVVLLWLDRLWRRDRCSEFPPKETRDLLVKGEVVLARVRDLLCMGMEVTLGDLLGVLKAAKLNEYFCLTAGRMELHFISPSVSSKIFVEVLRFA